MNTPTGLSRQTIASLIAFLTAFSLGGCGGGRPVSTAAADTTQAASAAAQPDCRRSPETAYYVVLSIIRVFS
jgi:hypothetical protein